MTPDPFLLAQLDSSLRHLESLIELGRRLRAALASHPASQSAIVSMRAWQQDCAAAVNELSGGSKAHWLARAYSEAFLLRSADGAVVDEAHVTEIVDRIILVLQQAMASLSRMRDGGASMPAATPQVVRRFDFVQNADLRPVLEQAYLESRIALERGEFALALMTTCGILEALITDALEKAKVDQTGSGPIATWSFDDRIAAAESAGLIRGGCARLPAVGRRYRDIGNATLEDPLGTAISEREARLAGQVLNVIMRDLNPGR
jgi:hypothetical protein